MAHAEYAGSSLGRHDQVLNTTPCLSTQLLGNSTLEPACDSAVILIILDVRLIQAVEELSLVGMMEGDEHEWTSLHQHLVPAGT